MSQKTGPVNITITPPSVIYAILIILGVWLLFYLKDLVLIVLTAIVLASSSAPLRLFVNISGFYFCGGVTHFFPLD